ncbi:TetR/AcrR family transcriptional regulator [Amycolatopsis suaedae]|uniref:TetR/AcrR family transcriptional regulator n=1 Tax=Amycolatopsis suaedae TaxID=2510978 RepID=A0A4Q7J144_9PSEU|nr:TetR/AcrR family transcriptional regulator [Amycolatopsis suaedae]RZQ60448.1 TetR/AcrR family transcriptional regulator [Amycolatopsis suaedae]
MSTDSDTTPRRRLVEAAVRLLADGGPETVQARRLAAEIGASTMAVYTHFGGMGALVEAVREEGFRRIADAVTAAPVTGDPVADLLRTDLAYQDVARDNPNLYAVTFGQAVLGGRRITTRERVHPVDTPSAEGQRAFGVLMSGVERAVAAGRLRAGSTSGIAGQLWSSLHGYLSLELTGYLGPRETAVRGVFLPLHRTLMVGLGDTPEAVARSHAAVVGDQGAN